MKAQKIQLDAPFFNIVDNGKEAEINIYGDIGWYDDAEWGMVSAAGFAQRFSKLKADKINLYINSPGGDVDQGFAIYNIIKRSNAKVVAYVDGLAASIASIIMLAADEVVANENSFVMIHNPWAYTAGGSDDLRKTADLLDSIAVQLAGVYTAATGKDEKEIREAMNAETWFNAQDAIDFGLAHKLSENKAQIAACASFDFTTFAHVPDVLKKVTGSGVKRNAEAVLRDAGWNRTEAKRLAAGPRRDDVGVTEKLDKLSLILEEQ